MGVTTFATTGSSPPDPSPPSPSPSLSTTLPTARDTPPPAYALPSTTDILVHRSKRPRETQEDTHDLGPAKRAKASDHARETVESPTGPTTMPPTTEIEDWFRDAADEGHSSERVDVSEDAFNAEMDEIFEDGSNGPPPLPNFFATNGDDSSDEEDNETVVMEDILKQDVTWQRPGSTPLREQLGPDASFDSSVKIVERKIIRIVRTPSPLRIDREDYRKEILISGVWDKVATSYADRVSKGGDHPEDANDGQGNGSSDDREKEREDDKDGSESDSSSDSSDESDLEDTNPKPIYLGRGTPAGVPFPLRPKLHLPASPYKYSTRVDGLPRRLFDQTAFHGENPWCKLLPSNRKAKKKADAHRQRIVRKISVTVGKSAERTVLMHTDKNAMDYWRKHEEEVDSLLLFGRKATTGDMIALQEKMQEILRGDVPSPESRGRGESVEMEAEKSE